MVDVENELIESMLIDTPDPLKLRLKLINIRKSEILSAIWFL